MRWISALLIVFSVRSSLVSTKCWNVSQVMEFPRHNAYAPRRYWQRQAEPILRGALYQMEDFTECLDELDGNYCMTKLHLQPTDNSTEFWQTIQKYNSVHTKFRRDILNVGLCVPKYCTPKDVIEDLQDFFSSAADKLKLSVNVSITSGKCETNEEKPIIALDYIVLFIILVLIIMLVGGTLYDVARRIKNLKNTSTKIGGKLLMCFSLWSNWERLTKVSDAEDSVSFRNIQGIRAVSIYLVVLGHNLYLHIRSPLRNTEVIEDAYNNIMKTSLFSGQLTMATFLYISGMMLSYFFIKLYKAKKSISVMDIFKAIVLRYLRLTPAFVVMILLQATFLYRFGTGPLWESAVGEQVENCRIYGWLNLLYLHNYIHQETMCLPHTWYLATDFQCYIISLLLLIPVCKYPRHAKKIFTFALLFWIFVPIIQTYVERLDPILMNTPERVKYQFLDRNFNRRYITMHANAGPFTVGVIFGYLYYHFKRTNYKPSVKMQVFLWGVAVTLPWMMLLMPFIFYQPSYTYDVVGASIFAGVSKVIFAAGMGVIVTFMSLGYGGVLRSVMSWKPLQVLGRLSYAIYLVHAPVLFLETGVTKQPKYISEFYIAQDWFKNIVTTSAFAFILVMFVELPTSSLMKLIINKDKLMASNNQDKEHHKISTNDDTAEERHVEEEAC